MTWPLSYPELMAVPELGPGLLTSKPNFFILKVSIFPTCLCNSKQICMKLLGLAGLLGDIDNP